MDRMNGMLGDRILVNGRPEASIDVDAGAYRLRILNGSNARIYRLAWGDDTPLTVIGTDGGLLERPENKRDILLSPGERIELWADFSRHSRGSDVRLVNRPLPEGASGSMMGRMMGRRMGGRALADDTTYTVVRFIVGTGVGQSRNLPDRLASVERYSPADADNIAYPRRFSLAMAHMQGVINGRVFALQDVAPDERVRLGATEIWDFANDLSGMGMMSMPMPHPMHIHAVQFQVLERLGATHGGYVDQGWKDTVLLLPGERVRVMARFAPFSGLYLYHCHNLEHEDGGMMRNFRIAA